MKKISLDAREMEHPKPLEKATTILRKMESDSFLYMLHRKNPIPLIELAKGLGYQVLNHEDNTGQWHILITKDTTVNLGEFLDV
ncbi:MAG: DUF2249 domain-containing protein [Sulfurimonas sp.]